jgi:hypothetical protein
MKRKNNERKNTNLTNGLRLGDYFVFSCELRTKMRVRCTFRDQNCGFLLSYRQNLTSGTKLTNEIQIQGLYSSFCSMRDQCDSELHIEGPK